MEIDPQNYSNAACKKFVKDMIKGGLGKYLRHYHGRYFWEGPGVIVHNLQDALSQTKIKCQSDCMGLDYVVYPIACCKFTAIVPDSRARDIRNRKGELK